MSRIASYFSIAMVATACTSPIASVAQSVATNERIEDVARRAAQVMPFELEKTRHIFNKTATGGQQRIEVIDANDAAQIELIRGHLAAIATEFREGRYADPAKVHGGNMPGLRELNATAPGHIRIDVLEHPLGGQIDFRTGDPVLITALHSWFDAQLSDHGSDAVSEHAHHAN